MADNAAIPERKRRWWQFSLRTLMIVVALLAIPLGYVSWQAKVVRERKTMRQWIVDHGGAINDTGKPPMALPLIRRLLGDERYWVVLPEKLSPKERMAIEELFPREVATWQSPP